MPSPIKRQELVVIFRSSPVYGIAMELKLISFLFWLKRK
jgi:hypothetical protein